MTEERVAGPARSFERGPGRVAWLAGQTFCVALTVYVAAHNLSTMGLPIRAPRALDDAAEWMGVAQAWVMYAPRPATVDFWYQRTGRLADGRWIDLDQEASGPNWMHVQRVHDQYRFRRYVAVIQFGHLHEDVPYAAWLCRTWNGEAPRDRQLSEVAMFRVEQDVHPDAPPSPPRALRIVSGACDRV